MSAMCFIFLSYKDQISGYLKNWRIEGHLCYSDNYFKYNQEENQ